MKAPLILLVTVFFICVFSGCREKTCYYYSEQPCGEVKGNVKTVTDTVYSVFDMGMTRPLQVREYHFDSLQRLVEEHHTFYCTDRDENGKEIATSIAHQHNSKHRYDRDGRKVESNISSSIYRSDSIYTIRTSMRLAILEGNNEMWEIDITEGGYTRKERLYRQYSEGQYQEDYEKTGERIRNLYIFDEKKRLIETRGMNSETEYPRIKYKYDDDNQLVEMKNMPIPALNTTSTFHYELDEFDNHGNWLKQVELDEKNEPRTIIRRRIEYRN